MDSPNSSLDPGSGWTLGEDNILIGAYINNKMNYEDLKRQLPNKTRDQCKARWTHYMQQTGHKGAWTRHEDQILHVCQKEYGNRWKSIKNFLPGRSENAVKNRWNAILRKSSPSPSDGCDDGSRSGSPSDGGFYSASNSPPLSRQQKQKQQSTGTSGRGNGNGSGGPSSSSMHLRLSPDAFGIHSESPGPSGADSGWGHTPGLNNSFNFFGNSPNATPKKDMLSPVSNAVMNGMQPPSTSGIGPSGAGATRTSGSGGGGRGNFGNTPMALKVDPNAPYGFPHSAGNGQGGSKLDESTSSMSREDMTELAEAFVAQEVEKFRKQHGETMSAEDQSLMRQAFVAGMQHSPQEKDMSGGDLQWEFDQSGSIDAMISMDEDGTGFDGVVQGRAIFSQSAKSPDSKQGLSRSGLGLSMGASMSQGGAGTSMGMPGQGGVPRTGSAGDMNLSIEGHSWGPLHSDLLNTENLDEMSMSLLNMSLEESQDHINLQNSVPSNSFHS